ncbi:hypothetical protein SGLAD_v1c05440 [Spiroplasma gladiatoris]|uniref:Uncharacterized protein n=1 Tax=Spiroplasma gladiatoris TaxID=2143 RepID=A0A4P7AJ34_9MOLU|nr:hypothetical protein [Spiroplasma gladiatoris]QBQ07743.1 hypothetical protein SGLAD_v1c05440 [Spiroplasma gladiatoris]
MEKNKKEEDIELIESVDKKALINEIKNNKIKNEEAKKFVEAIFENYFLDNDNINFLQLNGYNFFAFDDDQECFCLSSLTYKKCCKAKLLNIKDKSYKTYEQVIVKSDEYENYLLRMQNYFKTNYDKLSKLEKCNYPQCNNLSQENRLYEINFDKKNYLTTNNLNPFDNNFKIGENFFKKVTNKNFSFYGLCLQHYNEIRLITVDEQTSDDQIIKIHFLPLLQKLFISKVQLECLKEEFRNFYNSIEDEGYKALFIYRIKKISNLTSSLLNYLKKYKENLLNNKSLKVIKFKLNINKNIKVYDLLYPQVCPEDFSLVNSVNNIFVKENVASINIANFNNTSLTTIIYDSENERLKKFFYQYLKILDNKNKSIETFISNCSLILTDNILLNNDLFYKLDEQTINLFSALNKFRFENPNMGQEYLKMKFFAGFNKGNNFF